MHQDRVVALPSSAISSLGALPSSLVTRDHAEVSPFAREAPAPIRPITGRRSLAPRSHTRCPTGSPCGSLSLAGGQRVYHVPHTFPDGLGPAIPPATTWSAAGYTLPPAPGSLPCGLQPWPRGPAPWVGSTSRRERSSHMLAIPSTQRPTALVLAVAAVPRGLGHQPRGLRSTLSRRLRTPDLSDARSGRVRDAEVPVRSSFGTSYAT